MTTSSQATSGAARDEVELLLDSTALGSELVRAAHRGDILDCGEMVINELATTDDPSRVVRAEVMRGLQLVTCGFMAWVGGRGGMSGASTFG